MADSDERLRILKMIEEHKITAEEGVRLLAAVGQETEAPEDLGSAEEARAGKWLRIRVTDLATGRSKASVQIPIGLMDAGMKIGAKFAPEVHGVDMTAALEAIRSGASGKIIDVIDNANGEHVEISVD